MAHSYKFGIIRFASTPLRGEALNIGVLIETEAGLQVRYPARLERLRAISAALDLAAVEQDLRELPELMQRLNQTDLDSGSFAKALSSFSSFQLGQRGEINAATPELVELQLADLISRYIMPEPALLKPVKKRPTRLRKNIWNALRSEKILARPSEGLDSHRVVFQHKLSEGVIADFVLRNGAMHIVESVDVSENVSLNRALLDIAMSALTFEHARIEFPNQAVKPRLVYQASAEFERFISPSLYAAQHQGAEIINWNSQDQRNALLVQFSLLAQSLDEGKRHPSLFHSSTLPMKRIN